MRSLPDLIGIVGYAGVGKSEVARHLATRHGYVRPEHIKTPMVKMADALLIELGIDSASERHERLDGALKNASIPGYSHLSGRKILQVIGKDFRDGVQPDGLFFLQLWYKRACASAGTRCVLNESVRFQLEADWVRSQGGFLLRVERPGHVPTDPRYEPYVEGDATLLNDGTLEELGGRVDALVDDLRRFD